MPDTPPRPVLSLVPRDTSAAFYRRRAAEAGGSVLILGSAQGQIASELAGSGVEVTAVEPSELLMSQAKVLHATRSPEIAARMTLLQADLRSLRLGRTFALVLAPQNAFGALGTPEDLDDLLATVREHLDEGAEFIFDLTPPVGGPTAHHLDNPAVRPPPAPPPPRATFIPHLRERRRTPQKGADTELHRLRLRQFTPTELDEALAAAGLQATEKYGAFNGKPYDPGDPLLIVVASST